MGKPKRHRSNSARNRQAGRHSKAQRVACLVFGSVFAVFLMAVYVFQGSEVSSSKHNLLGLFGAIMAAAFSAVLPGNMGLTVSSPPKRWLGIGLRATGGLAVLALVLYWWNSNAPIIKRTSDVRIQISNLVASLEAKFNELKIALTNSDNESNVDDPKASQKREKALAQARRLLEDSLIGIIREMSLNSTEHDFVRAALRKIKDEGNDADNRQIPEISDPTEEKRPSANASNDPAPAPNPNKLVVISPKDLNISTVGVPSSVVVVYGDASERLKTSLFQVLEHTVGKFGEFYFVRNPYPENRAGPSIVYVGTDSKDMAECGKFVQYELVRAGYPSESSIRVFDVPNDQRPPMPPFDEGITSLWKLNSLKKSPGSVGVGFELAETGVRVSAAASRPDVDLPLGAKHRRGEPGKRAVWVYLP